MSEPRDPAEADARGTPVRVILADDHEIVRAGLCRVLEDEPGIAVVGQVGDGAGALDLLARSPADVLITDYNMPGMDAPSLIKATLAAFPSLKVLVLTAHDNAHYASKVLEAGAHGYVLKAAAVRELVEAIHTVCRGNVYVSPKVAQRVLANMRPGAERAGLGALSPKELEVLRALSSGMSLKECAAHLDVSVSTASTYRARLMEKLGLETSADMIRFAMEHHLVE